MADLFTVYKKYKEPKPVGGFGDKGSVHSYIEEYSKLFSGMSNPKLLEVGVRYGHSLSMWKEFFGENSIICGVDINIPKNFLFPPDKNGYYYTVCSSLDENIKMFFPNGFFDIIIDDGSHRKDHQIKTFENLNSKLSTGGFYIIEDIQKLDKDNTRNCFLELKEKYNFSSVTIIDNRRVKNRNDDVLAVFVK